VQGVELSHIAIVETVISLAWFLYAHKVGLTERDSMLGFLPLAHIFERCAEKLLFPVIFFFFFNIVFSTTIFLFSAAALLFPLGSFLSFSLSSLSLFSLSSLSLLRYMY
jgi:long-subunit acyl-CoA synthetase (AMP-forming)